MGNLMDKEMMMVEDEQLEKLLPDQYGGRTATPNYYTKIGHFPASSSSVDGDDRLRVKVRLSKRELGQLIKQLDVGDREVSSEELARLILQRGLEGRRCSATIFFPDDVVGNSCGINRQAILLEAKKRA